MKHGLALVRTDSKHHIDFLLKVLQEAVDSKIADKKITWNELDEILADFISQPDFKKSFNGNDNFIDGMSDYYKSKNLEKLWLIASMLPNGFGTKFIKNIPAKNDLFFELSEEILNKLSDSNLEQVLYREDVDVSEFRKKIFNDSKATEEIKCAAINCNFSLDIDEFISYTNQLKLDKSKKKLSLSDLGCLSYNLTPWLYVAIIDQIESNKEEKFDYNDIIWIKINLNKRLLHIEEQHHKSLEYYLAELKLYNLAERLSKKNLADFDNYLDWLSKHREKIAFLVNFISRDHHDDKWKIFKDLRKALEDSDNREYIAREITFFHESCKIENEFLEAEHPENVADNKIIIIQEQIGEITSLLKKNTEKLSNIKKQQFPLSHRGLNLQGF